MLRRAGLTAIATTVVAVVAIGFAGALEAAGTARIATARVAKVRHMTTLLISRALDGVLPMPRRPMR
jgi:hypothetical protein